MMEPNLSPYGSKTDSNADLFPTPAKKSGPGITPRPELLRREVHLPAAIKFYVVTARAAVKQLDPRPRRPACRIAARNQEQRGSCRAPNLDIVSSKQRDLDDPR